jgi:hypothetical protein
MPTFEVYAIVVFFQSLTLILGHRIMCRITTVTIDRELLHVHNPRYINAAMQNSHG